MNSVTERIQIIFKPLGTRKTVTGLNQYQYINEPNYLSYCYLYHHGTPNNRRTESISNC